jgi:hypothetical protein
MMKKFDSVFVHLACTDIGNMLQQLASYSVTCDTYLSGIHRWCIALLFHTCDLLGEYGRKNRVSRFSSVFSFPMPPYVLYGLCGLPLPVVAEV